MNDMSEEVHSYRSVSMRYLRCANVACCLWTFSKIDNWLLATNLWYEPHTCSLMSSHVSTPVGVFGWEGLLMHNHPDQLLFLSLLC